VEREREREKKNCTQISLVLEFIIILDLNMDELMRFLEKSKFPK